MKRFALSLLAALAPLATFAAAPVVTNIAMFPSLSVAYTNYVAQGTVTNALALLSGPLTINGIPQGFLPTIPSVPRSPSCYYTNIFLPSPTNGANTFLTVPSGMRFISTLLAFRPVTNNTIAWVAYRTNGVLVLPRQGTTINTNGTTINAALQFVFDQNEDVVIYASGDLTHATISGLLFTNAIPFRTARSIVTSGTTTLYTAPANRHAVLSILSYYNGSTGSVQRAVYHIPAGYAQDSTTLVVDTSVNTLTDGMVGIPVTILQPGDAITLTSNSSSAGQVAYITLLEVE